MGSSPTIRSQKKPIKSRVLAIGDIYYFYHFCYYGFARSKCFFFYTLPLSSWKTYSLSQPFLNSNSFTFLNTLAISSVNGLTLILSFFVEEIQSCNSPTLIPVYSESSAAIRNFSIINSILRKNFPRNLKNNLKIFY